MRALLVAGLMAGTAWGQAEVIQVQAPAAPRRFELTLQPVRVQVNGKFTQHLGTFGVLSWSPREHVALQLLGGANWYNEESAFNGELVEKFRVEAQAATSLLWTWGLFGAVELEPFLGEFTLFHGPRAQLGFVISVGAGVGGTRHQLKPTTQTPATYGDTGARFMATAAAGLRFRVGKHFTARLEVRDVGFSSDVTTVNGCNVDDLSTLARQALRVWDDGSLPYLSPSCRGFPPGQHGDAFTAQHLAQQRSTEIIHDLGVALGAGFTF